MRAIILFVFSLPLLAQAPATQAPAGGQVPKPESQPAAQPAATAPASDQAAAGNETITGTIDVGYRWLTDVKGDFNTYRSVVNLGEGPKLLGVDLTIQPKRFADRIDVNLSSWGGDPYNTARIYAKKTGLYDFRFDYRNIAYFNFLPSFANPGRINPALPFIDQYSFDIHRRTADFQLDLFPGHRIIPYVAYTRNGGRGNGLQNFVLERNEYTVPSRYSDHTNEYRGGVRFEFSRWHATTEVGGFNFRDDQQLLSPVSSPASGNLTTTFLGRQLFLNNSEQAYGIRGDAVFTRGMFTANPFNWLDVTAQFLYSQPKNDVHLTQAASGLMFTSSLPLPFFFNSEILDWSGTVKQPHPTGDFGFVLKPFGGRLRIIESFNVDRQHTAGSAVLLEQFLTTGQAPTPLTVADSARYVTNYNQQEVNVAFDLTRMFTLRAGDRYRWGDLEAPASLTAEGQGFETERAKMRQHIALAGFTFRTPQKFRVNADLEFSPGGPSYFRTSVNEYQRARITARWQAKTSLQLSARFNVFNNQNPDPAIRYDFLSRDNTFSAYWNPSAWKGFGVLAEYSRSTVRSDIFYIVPNFLSQDTSRYRENANIGTLLADLPFKSGKNPIKLSLGGSFFRSSGSRPSRFYQPMARLALPIREHIQFNTEWRWYGLSQPFYQFEGFRSHQFLTALRFSM